MHQHYHFALFINGNEIQHPYKVTAKAQEIWSKELGLDTRWCVNYDSSISVRRNEFDFPAQLNKLYHMLQYLAKPLTKIGIDDGNRNFACSQL